MTPNKPVLKPEAQHLPSAPPLSPLLVGCNALASILDLCPQMISALLDPSLHSLSSRSHRRPVSLLQLSLIKCYCGHSGKAESEESCVTHIWAEEIEIDCEFLKLSLGS